MRASLLLLLLAGCATPRAAERVVVRYLSAEARGEMGRAHRQLSDEDRAARPLDAYVEDHAAAGPLWLAIARHTDARVGAARPAGEVHIVPVTTHSPDGDAVLAACPGRMTDQAVAFACYDRAAAALPATRAASQDLGALWRRGRWWVWLALDRQDAAKARHATLIAALEAGDSAAADAAWAALQRVPPDPGGAVRALQRDGEARMAEQPAR